MKEIKAYVHASRIADVIAGLKGSTVWGDPNHDEHNLAVYVVKGSRAPGRCRASLLAGTR